MGIRFLVSEKWRAAYPGSVAGFLAVAKTSNPKSCPALDGPKGSIEEDLRTSLSDREAIRALPRIKAYTAYYKRFKKTYHVAHQLESVALKGKSLPRVAALVEAMFMAEIKNLLLTAGHDLQAVSGPIRLDVAGGQERYLLLGGQEQQLKSGDMFMADDEGIISSVIYGPDQRTQITPATTEAVFCVYAPAGIGPEAVRAHLEDIEAYVRLISPEAEVITLETHSAD